MIPVLGAPLVGKGTVVRHLAKEWPGKLATYELPVDIGAARVLACRIQLSARHVDVWCLPGGIEATWPLEIAKKCRAGVLVLDPQRDYAERQREFVDLYINTLDLQWYVIQGKQDLARSGSAATWDPIPDVLRGVPVLRYCGRASDAGSRVRDFFVENNLLGSENEEGVGLDQILGPEKPIEYLASAKKSWEFWR